MLITVISVCGKVRHIRPFPSDSTTHRVPVSAIAKFAPLIPTVADRNCRRRYTRAASASALLLSVRPGSIGPALRIVPEQIPDSVRF